MVGLLLIMLTAADAGPQTDVVQQLPIETALGDTEVIPSDRFVVSIVLMGPGEQLFSRWGHIAIRVDDKQNGLSRVFNHGTFDFSGTEDLYAYAKGFLRFRLATSSWRSTEWTYTAQDRDLWVCPLDVGHEREAQAVALLEDNLLPENRYYAYRHYLDNCTTRTRDVVLAVAGKSLAPFRDEVPTGNTFRTWTREYLMGTPVMRLLILFALGPSVDVPVTRWQEHFLPDLLVEDLKAATGPNGQPLLRECQHVVERQGPPPRQHVAFWERAVIAGLVAALALGLLVPFLLSAGVLRRRLHGIGFLIWSMLGGGGGLVLAVFWLFTEHDDTWANENLFAFVPLHILLVVPAVMLLAGQELSERFLRILCGYLSGALILVFVDVLLKVGPLNQDNGSYLAVATAIDLALLVAVQRMRPSNSRCMTSTVV
ncbi:MAG: hypothetical protein A2289_06655 [Deltaproteobacteria bacterium RIFOXYA12_FULL_58_15]|nr:MAG: hypothetical protein A2289_06655 [Deltaproteobacteria bacterium RIFOXYA12_FULL_58_15]OGR10809.1 MAG: hypothetical protein A2341_24860 [Deltaproteobacteria bacterium RIFOXYB12_FULL_58_9]